MFKRAEAEPQQTEHPFTPAAATDSAQTPRTQATIGATIHIKGDVTGDENLTVEGTVEGTITVKQHSLHIGKNGRINADIYARVIRIDGQVEGNLHADEQVVIRQSGVVRGNITSPRLSMEDGCSFKGSIDMDNRQAAKKGEPESANRGKPTVVNGGGNPVHANGADGKADAAGARPA